MQTSEAGRLRFAGGTYFVHADCAVPASDASAAEFTSRPA